MRHDICPAPKPRMTQRDRWAQRPAVLRYRAFCDEVRAAGVEIPESGAHLVFVLPMPKSWSKKKRAAMNGKPHQQKPDVDNLLKAVLDAVHSDDAHIWSISAAKLWGEVGSITITTEQNAQSCAA